MKRLFANLKKHIKRLNIPIYRGKKLENNLSALVFLGIVVTAFGVLMSILNIVQKKGFITYTTIFFALSGLLVIVFAKVMKRREPAVLMIVVSSALIFSYYAISGANEGFAILWTLLMPMVISYFLSVRYGILLSVYFELLTIILFYTPLRSFFGDTYTVTFMNRFPILYLCGVLTTTVSMSQYHESVLFEIEYTSKLSDEVALQTRVATERANKLERLSDEIVIALARTIDAKDKYTNGHSLRVSEYAVAVAERLGWTQTELKELKREALLHDIGKIGVPDSILNKPGRLTPEEFDVVKSHTVIGRSILEGLEDMNGIVEVAECHHERYDGKGYPKGLAGDDIPDHARIVALADAYDAMNSDRIYRPALTKEQIKAELDRCAGTQFDPVFALALIELIDEGKV